MKITFTHNKVNKKEQLIFIPTIAIYPDAVWSDEDAWWFTLAFLWWQYTPIVFRFKRRGGK